MMFIDPRKDLFLTMTFVDAQDIRRWRVSGRCVDPYDYRLAGVPCPDHQIDRCLHEEIDRFEQRENDGR